MEVSVIRHHIRGVARQSTHDVVTLYDNAAAIKIQFAEIMQDIAQHAITAVDIPDSLKPLGRTLEKMVMRPRHSQSCDNVCDVVRCLFIAKAISRVADIAGKSSHVVCDRASSKLWQVVSRCYT